MRHLFASHNLATVLLKGFCSCRTLKRLVAKATDICRSVTVSLKVCSFFFLTLCIFHSYQCYFKYLNTWKRVTQRTMGVSCVIFGACQCVNTSCHHEVEQRFYIYGITGLSDTGAIPKFNSRVLVHTVYRGD